METKHTPGPWFADDSARLVYSHGPSRGLTGNAEDCPAIVKYDDVISRKKADLLLIAAAPDLLDLLAMALPYVEEAENDPAYKPGTVAKLARNMRALIERVDP